MSEKWNVQNIHSNIFFFLLIACFSFLFRLAIAIAFDWHPAPAAHFTTILETVRMLITRWNSVRRKVSYHLSNWMVRKSLIRPSLYGNWALNSKKIWMRASHKINVTSLMPPYRWLKTIWFGFCSIGASKIPIYSSKVTRWTCNTHLVAVCPTASWTSSSALHTDAR